MVPAFRLRHAASTLRAGGVILYPTDTIYGLGCDPFNHQAVSRIYAIKRRSGSKTLILVASERSQLDSCIDVDSNIELQADTPTTWIVPAAYDCPPWLIAEDGTIAVRITRHPVIKALCDTVESPIISTSANISGRRPVRDAASIHASFHGLVDDILVDNSQSTGKPSTIRSLVNDDIIRA